MLTNAIPWIEKYRPTRLSNIVDHPDIIKTLKNALKYNNIPHLLFHGSPGTGKTTTILAVARELYGPNNFANRVLELNASDERGIGMVRSSILNFVRASLSGVDPLYPSPAYKILILDEADAMTMEAQTALRRIMEEYSLTTRFCIICNYIDKIISPITSRCMQFKFFALSANNIKLHLQRIAEKEKLIIDDNIFDTITEISKGDLRKAIGTLQNVKYFQGIEPVITPEIVYNLEGDIPTTLVNKMMNDIHDNVNVNVVKLANEIYSNGYPIVKLCEKLIIINKENKIIVSKLIKILRQLNNGCNDYLQLINIIYIIKNFK